MSSERVFLAFGSNLGDRQKNIENAIVDLSSDPAVQIVKQSRFLENEALVLPGATSQPSFLNCVIEIATSHEPRILMQLLQQIEQAAGRERGAKWAARTLDIDIVLWGTRIIDEHEMTIPHPQMHKRSFVLGPLVELAPNVVHPVMKKTVGELVMQLSNHAAGVCV